MGEGLTVEQRLGGGLGEFGVAPDPVEADGDFIARLPFGTGLHAQHAGLVDVLPLRAGAAGRQGAEDRGDLRGVGDRDVGDGILDPVMEQAGVEFHRVGSLPVERAFKAVEALGIEAGVGLGEVVADAEGPVELVERRQAEAGAGGQAEREVVG